MSIDSKYISLNKPKVAIIVPFRDTGNGERTEQLRLFISYMTSFMKVYQSEVIKWKIFIAEQSQDNLKFNRGRILNYAALVAISQGYDTLIFHDVDLIPDHKLFKWYISKPVSKIVYNISSWTERYGTNLKLGAGGIVSIRSDDFIEVDGYPNIFWGWGGEDTELAKRLKIKNIKIIGPTEIGLIKDLEIYVTHKDKAEQLFKVNKNIKCSVLYELKDIYDKLRNINKKPSWWGIKNIDKAKKTNLYNKKHLQHTVIYFGLTENFPIYVKTKQGTIKIGINDTAQRNFYINY